MARVACLLWFADLPCKIAGVARLGVLVDFKIDGRLMRPLNGLILPSFKDIEEKLSLSSPSLEFVGIGATVKKKSLSRKAPAKIPSLLRFRKLH